MNRKKEQSCIAKMDSGEPIVYTAERVMGHVSRRYGLALYHTDNVVIEMNGDQVDQMEWILSDALAELEGILELEDKSHD